MNNKLIVECGCEDLAHAVKFFYFTKEPDDQTVEPFFITTVLCHHPWYKRLWYAARYIFCGNVSKFGVSQECVVDNPQKVVELRNLLDKYLEDNNGGKDNTQGTNKGSV